ncbi:D-amino acid aminotransferase [Thalassotalea sp. M1531]|uniref:Aminodeoxychorismate lyase n=1 Tax=Thalassotalea algicola TaxID=2716224 RepID=A0A7Y0LBC2_9GAMM|nr:D-amino acid aminotransferase [Thalassotalea algicola]NMP31017.1 D-amino acid aminotransferase [Thalassotalea algicola]
MTKTVYLNGEYIAKQDAKVSVCDRGFLFADSIYEVIPVYNNEPFRLKEHLDRLEFCLSAINLDSPHSSPQWQELIEQVINKNGGGHLSIYIQVTRGSDKERDHVLDKQTLPTVLIMPMPLSTEVATLKAIKVALLDDFRWQHCDIKTTALLGNIILRNQAQDNGFEEAILYRDNQVTEATASNVFMVKGKVIYTPPKNNYILAGITRDLIIELAEKASIKVVQSAISVEQLLQADEVWISSSSREISPVYQINDKIIANGEIGDTAREIHKLFQSFKQSLVNGQA